MAGSPRERARRRALSRFSMSQAYAGAEPSSTRLQRGALAQVAFWVPTCARADCAAAAARAAADGGGYAATAAALAAACSGGRRSRWGEWPPDATLPRLERAVRCAAACLRRPSAARAGARRATPSTARHRPDLTVLLEGLLIVFDLKVFAPNGSDAGEVELLGGFVAFGNSTPRGQLLVHGRRERLGPPATFNKTTLAGLRFAEGASRRARRSRGGAGRGCDAHRDVRGGLGTALVEKLRKLGVEWRANKLIASEYDVDDVVGADVDGVHDTAPLGSGAVLGRAGGGRDARSACRWRPTHERRSTGRWATCGACDAQWSRTAWVRA